MSVEGRGPDKGNPAGRNAVRTQSKVYGPTRVWNSLIDIVTGFPATSDMPSIVIVCSAASAKGVCGVTTTVRS